MPNTDNYFRRQLDRGKTDLARTQESIRKAVGIGKTAPLGQVKLTRSEKQAYFWGQPDQKKLELWNQMGDGERAEIAQGRPGAQ